MSGVCSYAQGHELIQTSQSPGGTEVENRMRVKYLTSLTVGKEFTPVCQLITIGKTQVCSVKSSEWSAVQELYKDHTGRTDTCKV